MGAQDVPVGSDDEVVPRMVHTVYDYNDKSRSRSDRCSMSRAREQEAQHLLTSVESTVVNKQDIDKCPETNKPGLAKQGSSKTSNKWLSNTFSRLTSSVLGKNKVGKDFEFMENSNANNSQNVLFKPQFNFFL